MRPELYGLVACGGKSSRMGVDKSMLVYHDKPQRYHVYEMLQSLCGRVFLSCNKDQADETLPQYEFIADEEKYSGIGPMAGVLSAFEKFPHASFLFVGCDYPFITKNHLMELVNALHDSDDAACFCHPEAHIPEPLVAIFQSRSFPKLLNNFARQKYSLMHFLRESDTCMIYPASGDFLISVNDMESFLSVKEALSSKKAG